VGPNDAQSRKELLLNAVGLSLVGEVQQGVVCLSEQLGKIRSHRQECLAPTLFERRLETQLAPGVRVLLFHIRYRNAAQK
jgi:hypothetical protein